MIHPVRVDGGGYRPFGYNLRGWYHIGHDYNTPEGEPVYAIDDGVILYSGDVAGFGGTAGNRGGVIIINHAGITCLYGHLQRTRDRGQVKKGEVIGFISSYDLNGVNVPHLHFGLYASPAIPPTPWGYVTQESYPGQWIDPILYLRGAKWPK
jgi:murein DD-endopeptidase MepM/ murein hydrolase activator NlpD